MPKSTYNVSQSSSEKDSSFKSFILALLAFLALCIIIYLFLILGSSLSKNSNSPGKEEVEIFQEDGNATSNEKYRVVQVPVPPETTTRKFINNFLTTTTTTTTSSPPRRKPELSYSDELDDDYDYQPPTAASKQPKATSTSARTTTTTENYFRVATVKNNPPFLWFPYTTTDYPKTVTTEETLTTENKAKLYYPNNVVTTEKTVEPRTEPTTWFPVKSTTADLASYTKIITPTTSTYPKILITTTESGTSFDDSTLGSSTSSTFKFVTSTDAYSSSTTEEEISTETTEVPSTSFPLQQNPSTKFARPYTLRSTTVGTTEDFGSTSVSSQQFSTTQSQKQQFSGPVNVTSTTSVGTTEDITAATVPRQQYLTTQTRKKQFSGPVIFTSTTVGTTEDITGNTDVPVQQYLTTRQQRTFYGPVNVTSTTSIGTTVPVQQYLTTQNQNKQFSGPVTLTSTTVGTTEDITSSATTDYSTIPTTIGGNQNSTTYHGRKISRVLKKTTTSSPTFVSQGLCNSATCTSTAARMLSLMNHSAEACEDFYEFACGGQGIHNSADSDSVDMLSTYLRTVDKSSGKYLRDFKMFYDSCVNHEKQFKFSERMMFFVTHFQQIDLTDLISEMILTQSLPLFDVGIDIENATLTYILQLTVPGQSSMKSTIKDWSILDTVKKSCLKDQKPNVAGGNLNLTKIYQSYKKCQREKLTILITNFVQEMHDNKLFQQALTQDLFESTVLNETLQLLDALDDLPKDSVVRTRVVNKEYELYTVAHLQQNYPLMKWTQFFTTLTGHTVDNNNLVQVYFSNYLSKVFNQLSLLSHSAIHRSFRLLLSMQFYENTVIPKNTENREKYCTDLSKALMPDVITNIYRLTHSRLQLNEKNLELSVLFRDLRSKFKDSIENFTQLDEISRNILVGKLNKLKLALVSIGDVKIFEQQLEGNYQDLKLGKNYQNNLYVVLKHYRKMIFSLAETNVTENSLFSYFVSAYDELPQTFYPSEIIVAPAGIFERAPVDLPEYLLKARVGFHLAKEIARHFDPVGIRYRMTETANLTLVYNYLSTNTDESLLGYARSDNRLYQGKMINFPIDEKLSTNDRITDNTAFRLVYDSLQSLNDGELLPWISSSYSREKLFFIATAQEYCKKTDVLDFMLNIFESEHLPSILRLENVMSNSEAFSKFFYCPKGHGLNSLPEPFQFPYLNFEDDYYLNN